MTRYRMLVDAASELAPVVSEARTLDRFIAPVQRKTMVTCAESLVELGS